MSVLTANTVAREGREGERPHSELPWLIIKLVEFDVVRVSPSTIWTKPNNSYNSEREHKILINGPLLTLKMS